LNVCAILAIRNEEAYLLRCLTHLVDQGVQVYVIDNESTDGSQHILDTFAHPLFLGYEILPFPGYFDLAALLVRKQKLRSVLNTDWIIHHDADEVMTTDVAGETLAEGIQRIASQGYTAINFQEFTFLPPADMDFTGIDYVAGIQTYYHFRPKPIRLVRAFANHLPVSLGDHGGHRFDLSQVRLYPGDFQLRHYIALSRERFFAKYHNRIYPQFAIDKGWHRNRTLLTHSEPAFPDLNVLSYASAKKLLDTSRPVRHHFWQWTDRDRNILSGIKSEKSTTKPRHQQVRAFRQWEKWRNQQARVHPFSHVRPLESAPDFKNKMLKSGEQEIQWLFQYLRQLPVRQEREQALLIGLHAGRLLGALAPHFGQVQALEPSRAQLLLAEAHTEYPNIYLRKMEFTSGHSVHHQRFELIYASRHLFSLPPVLLPWLIAACLDSLIPGGLLLFELPISDRRKVETPGKWPRFLRPKQIPVFRYSPDHIREMVESRNGFLLDNPVNQGSALHLQTRWYAISK